MSYKSRKVLVERIVEQNPHLGSIFDTVARLCPFRSWLTFIFGTEMADVTLDTFHLDGSDQLQIEHGVTRRQHTHGSLLSHLSLDALHREQDDVNLRPPESMLDEVCLLAFPSCVL